MLKEGATAGPYASLADAKAAGAVSINYGAFINTIISFIIIAFAIFMVIRAMNSAKKKEEAPLRNRPTRNARTICPRFR